MKIVCYPDDILRGKAETVTEFDDQLRKIADEMIRTMHENNGVGLAAPQVGLSIRLVVLNVSEQTDGDMVLVNPRIVAGEGAEVGEEGCLSFPGIYINVQRAAVVTVEYQDLDGRTHRVEGDGLLARAFQHETDHLDGVLLADKMNAVQRMANRRNLRMLQMRHEYRRQRAADGNER